MTPADSTRRSARLSETPAPLAGEPVPIEAPAALPARTGSTIAQRYVEVQLPSRGLLYGPASAVPTPAIPDGIVEIRKMLFSEEEALWESGGDLTARLSRVIASVTKLPPKFDPLQLLVSDRFYLLLALRTICFGSQYQMSYRCEECNKPNQHAVDIAKDLSEKSDAATSEPIFVTLPDAGVEIGLRLRRGFDELEAIKDRRLAERRGVKVGASGEALRQQILEVDGEKLPPLALMDLVKKFTSTDLLHIRVAMTKADHGIDLTVYPTCTHCSFTNETEMPFTVEFFRPTNL